MSDTNVVDNRHSRCLFADAAESNRRAAKESFTGTPKVLQKFSTAVTSQPDNHLYEFGPFSLDLSERQLFRNGKPVSLTPEGL
jgi:DNA-binding response OmpR family regulator